MLDWVIWGTILFGVGIILIFFDELFFCFLLSYALITTNLLLLLFNKFLFKISLSFNIFLKGALKPVLFLLFSSFSIFFSFERAFFKFSFTKKFLFICLIPDEIKILSFSLLLENIKELFKLFSLFLFNSELKSFLSFILNFIPQIGQVQLKVS